MKTGRPKKDIEKRISIRVSEDMYGKIKYLSNRRGQTVSEYLREVLERSVK